MCVDDAAAPSAEREREFWLRCMRSKHVHNHVESPLAGVSVLESAADFGFGFDWPAWSSERARRLAAEQASRGPDDDPSYGHR